MVWEDGIIISQNIKQHLQSIAGGDTQLVTDVDSS